MIRPAGETINPKKSRCRTGEYYASCHPELPQELRLDVWQLARKTEISFRLYRDIHKDL